MIRMLHFADVHLGVETYGKIDPQFSVNTRILDFLKRLDEMIGFALENGVDLAIFAGDAFKNRQPNPTLQREFASRILELAEKCPVVMLVGNHDIAATLQRASSIEIYETLDVPNVLVGKDYELHDVTTKSGPVLVGTAPYPIRGGLLDDAHLHGKTIAQIDGLLQDSLQVILRDLAQRASRSAAPRVLTGHFTVVGAAYGSERSVMAGRDVAVMLSELADPTWDYVALGHIHKHQNLTANMSGLPPVVYSGSLERIDFGEEADAKGFCWVELERGQTTWQFRPVQTRPFITLQIDVRRSVNPMQDVADLIAQCDLTEAVVRMVIQADMETESKLRDTGIHDLLRDAGVSIVAGVQKEVERRDRSRLSASPEGLSRIDLLEHYLKLKEYPNDRIALLLERAEAFLSEE